MSTQALFNFDGPDLAADDKIRLGGQLLRVFALMRDGLPRTLDQIVEATGGTTASASARLRDLRKEKFGGHTVIRQRIVDGLFEYTVKVRSSRPAEVLKGAR